MVTSNLLGNFNIWRGYYILFNIYINRGVQITKEKYKVAIVKSEPYMIILAVIGLSVYLNALIVQDSITLFVAVIIGYVLVSVIIALEVISLILLNVSEVEIAIKDKKIEALELELKAIKNRR